MKKVMLLIGLLWLAGCESGNGSAIGKPLIQNWVDTQCRSELNQRNEWKLISALMGAKLKQEWEDKICGCASEEAVNNMSQADMVSLISREGRARTIAQVTTKTVGSCITRLYHGQ